MPKTGGAYHPPRPRFLRSFRYASAATWFVFVGMWLKDHLRGAFAASFRARPSTWTRPRSTFLFGCWTYVLSRGLVRRARRLTLFSFGTAHMASGGIDVDISRLVSPSCACQAKAVQALQALQPATRNRQLHTKPFQPLRPVLGGAEGLALPQVGVEAPPSLKGDIRNHSLSLCKGIR